MKDEAIDRFERLTESDDPLPALLKQVYHIPVLVALMGFMLVTRLRRIDQFQASDGVKFSGNDAWYHFRETSYLIDNFPSTMPFDPMTNYPTGTSAEQFGTLYDQIVAGVILVTSLGDPSPEHAGLVMLIAAPVFGVAAVIPAYLIATRFVGRGSALAGIAVLALLPGGFLRRTLVGFYDHAAAEIFFQTVAVLAFVVALSVAQREQPIWELVVDRDISALRRPLIYSTAAGVAAALYMWAWPPGILLVGFTGVFFAIKLTSDVFHGQTPEPIAFVGVVSMVVTGLLMFVPLNSLTIGSPTEHTLLQVILPLGVGFGCVFLSLLARGWEDRSLSQSLYPVFVGGILVLTTGITAVLLPALINRLRSSLLRSVGFGTGSGTRTIAEAQPFLDTGAPFDVIYSEYRLALFTAILGALILLARPLIQSEDTRETGYVVGALGTIAMVYFGSSAVDQLAGVFGTSWQIFGLVIALGSLLGAALLNRYDASKLYLVIWAAFITSAAFTQVRFNYYLAIVVAVFNAIFVAQVVGYLDIETATNSVRDSVDNLEGWQVMAAVTLVFLIIAPFAVPTVAAWEGGGQNGVSSSSLVWEGELEWMNTETPKPGELGGANNTIDPLGTYERPPDGDFDYPDGAYGVQSWWDYGHWITVHGDRIPNANPFQQGATEAAKYLLASNETAAEEALAEKMGEDGETRYVMVDWQMVAPTSKFSAPVVFNPNANLRDFVNTVRVVQGNNYQGAVNLRTQRYYESQMVRLYAYHGSAANPRPIVVETGTETINYQGQSGTIQNAVDRETGIRTFETLAEAEAYVNETPGAQIGGIGDNPTERVAALEHYRLVKASGTNAARSSGLRQNLLTTQARTGVPVSQQLRNIPSWVKTFEKVPGATVDGSGAPAGAEVTATVPMEIPSNGQRFNYVQYATADENGNFEMTLPYSTTGYDEFGPENGYTNVSVRALGDYQFAAGQQAVGSAAVTEAQVIGEDNSAVEVELGTAAIQQLGG